MMPVLDWMQKMAAFAERLAEPEEREPREPDAEAEALIDRVTRVEERVRIRKPWDPPPETPVVYPDDADVRARYAKTTAFYTASGSAWTQSKGYPVYATANPCESDGDNVDTDTTVNLVLPAMASRWTDEDNTVVGYVLADGKTGVPVGEPGICHYLTGHVIHGIAIDPGLPVLSDLIWSHPLDYRLWYSQLEPNEVYGFDTGWAINQLGVLGRYLAVAGDDFPCGDHGESSGFSVTPTGDLGGPSTTENIQQGDGAAVAVASCSHVHALSGIKVEATAADIELPYFAFNVIHWVELGT